MTTSELLDIDDNLDIATVRARLREDNRHQFVDREEFCNLLVSKKNLQRIELSDGKIRGLLDRATGRRYLIEENKLFDPAI